MVGIWYSGYLQCLWSLFWNSDRNNSLGILFVVHLFLKRVCSSLLSIYNCWCKYTLKFNNSGENSSLGEQEEAAEWALGWGEGGEVGFSVGGSPAAHQSEIGELCVRSWLPYFAWSHSVVFFPLWASGCFLLKSLNNGLYSIIEKGGYRTLSRHSRWLVSISTSCQDHSSQRPWTVSIHLGTPLPGRPEELDKYFIE